MVHAFQLLFIDCNYPKAFVWWIGMHAVMFFFLFNEFYKAAYRSRMMVSRPQPRKWGPSAPLSTPLSPERLSHIRGPNKEPRSSRSIIISVIRGLSFPRCPGRRWRPAFQIAACVNENENEYLTEATRFEAVRQARLYHHWLHCTLRPADYKWEKLWSKFINEISSSRSLGIWELGSKPRLRHWAEV